HQNDSEQFRSCPRTGATTSGKIRRGIVSPTAPKKPEVERKGSVHAERAIRRTGSKNETARLSYVPWWSGGIIHSATAPGARASKNPASGGPLPGLGQPPSPPAVQCVPAGPA